MKFFAEVVHLDCTSRELFILLVPIVLTKLDCLGTV